MPDKKSPWLDDLAAFSHAVSLVSMYGAPAGIEYLPKWHQQRKSLGISPRAAEDTEMDDAGEEDAEADFDE
jgi:hypothetical protein